MKAKHKAVAAIITISTLAGILTSKIKDTSFNLFEGKINNKPDYNSESTLLDTVDFNNYDYKENTYIEEKQKEEPAQEEVIEEPEETQIEVVEKKPITTTDIMSTKSINDAVDTIVVVTNTDVNVRTEPNTSSEVKQALAPNEYLPLINDELEDWYTVDYYGETCYLSKNYTHLETKKEFPYDYEKIVYITEDTQIYSDENCTSYIADLPKLEAAEVYASNNGKLLVKTNEYIGYIDESKTIALDGTFVIVDISDQTLKLYENNKCIYTTPVVTGKPSTPTDEGIFAIYSITYDRYLIGANYKSYVDVFMAYNGGEGLHDAEYHVCDAAKAAGEANGLHGWRNSSEFGGEIYINHGSHGCVNMLNDAANYVEEHVSVGTPVLVKK